MRMKYSAGSIDASVIVNTFSGDHKFISCLNSNTVHYKNNSVFLSICVVIYQIMLSWKPGENKRSSSVYGFLCCMRNNFNWLLFILFKLSHISVCHERKEGFHLFKKDIIHGATSNRHVYIALQHSYLLYGHVMFLPDNFESACLLRRAFQKGYPPSKLHDFDIYMYIRQVSGEMIT